MGSPDHQYNAAMTSLTGELLDRTNHTDRFLQLNTRMEDYSDAVFRDCNGLLGVVTTMKQYGDVLYPQISSRLNSIYVRQIQEVHDQWHKLFQIKRLLEELQEHAKWVSFVFSSRIQTLRPLPIQTEQTE